MEQVRHNTLGIGEVVRKEVNGGFTILNVRFANEKELRFSIPQSFETGAVEALGSLKDEVEQVIAEKKARLNARATCRPLAATTKRAARTTKKAATKAKLTGPIPTAFEMYLIHAGYSKATPKGAPSTVYAYTKAVEAIRAEEGISWGTLKADIKDIVAKYDKGGLMSWFGAKSNNTYINALKQFAEFGGGMP